MTDKQKMDKILRDLESDEHVQQMKNYTQHGKVSTYEHCERVAKLSYELNKKLHLHAQVPTLIKGAMLHDVPPEIDRRVAQMKLATWGVSIDTLTPEQHRYIFGF